MLHDTDYARQLDSALDLVGNDLGALDRLNAALALMPDYEDEDDSVTDDTILDECRHDFGHDDGFGMDSEDWREYEAYLDRLDAEREYPEIESPVWSAWLAWLHTPAELSVDDMEPVPF